MLTVDEPAIYLEGTTKLSTPPPRDVPAMLPAFFNPKGKFVRDVSIACYEAFAEEERNLTFADALCGTGARGIRVANEIPFGIESVFLNDVNSKALEYAENSARLNLVEEKCRFSKMEACAFLSTRAGNNGVRFDIVDVDPFGTPSPFVESAVRAIKDGGLLSVAATDSAVLCGVYPQVAQRKYGGYSLRTDYSHEIGLRLIFGLMAQSAMRLEAGIEPIFCHHDMHYFRAYCRVKVGNSYSLSNQSEMGFAAHCFVCGFRSLARYDELFHHIPRRRAEKNEKETEFSLQDLECRNCKVSGVHSRLSIGGPLWIGKIASREFVSLCAKVSKLPLFQVNELDVPLYYDLTALSKRAASRTPKLSDVMNALIELGYATSRTRLNPNALRTAAPLRTLRSVVSEFAR